MGSPTAYALLSVLDLMCDRSEGVGSRAAGPRIRSPGGGRGWGQLQKKSAKRAAKSCFARAQEVGEDIQAIFFPPSPPAEKATDSHEDRPQLSVALRMVRLRTIYRAENIGDVLKRVVNVCQREFVNEVLGLLVTEFVRNFGRENARPIQHAFHGGLLDAM